MALQFPLLALLLAVAAFFAISETALFGLSQLQRRKLEKDAELRGKLAAKLLQTPSRLLTSILLGNTLAQVAFVALATDLALAELDARTALTLSILGSTAILLLAGEVAPKVIAAASPLMFSRLVARPLAFSERVLSSVARPMELISHAMAGLFAARPTEEALPASQERSGKAREGGRESDLVEYLSDFQETVARQVMTPRADILAGDLDWPQERARGFIRKARTSRLPFFRENLDNVEGVLSVKRYLLAGRDVVSEFLEPPYFIPEGKRLSDLLRDFQQKEIEIAIVLDEHGQTTGLVTMEDILEEIFGEVYDEGEEEDEDIVLSGENSWRVRGRALLSDVEREIGFLLEADEGIDTLGGLVMNYLGEIPKKGDSFILSNHTITITKVAQHRVKEVTVQRLGPAVKGTAS